MKGRSAQVSIPSVESAELLGDAFTVLVHELGAIATALSLRAEVLKGAVPAADQSALLALAVQLAEVKKTMRVVQGPRRGQSLAPEAVLSSTFWFRIAQRLSAPALPRGTTWKEEIGEATLTGTHANALLNLWLCACRALPTETGGTSPQLIATLVGRPEGRVGAEFTVTLVLPDHAADTPTRAPLRWRRYAERVARRHGSQMEWWTRSGSQWVWRCIIE